MKKVIERLEQALALIWNPPTYESEKKFLDVTVSNVIKEAIKDLQTPRWYTPERWEAETGEQWPDNGAVYFRRPRAKMGKLVPELGYIRWASELWGTFRRRAANDISLYHVVCAIEAGPPPKDWRPEEIKEKPCS